MEGRVIESTDNTFVMEVEVSDYNEFDQERVQSGVQLVAQAARAYLDRHPANAVALEQKVLNANMTVDVSRQGVLLLTYSIR
jgi:hypothetical protein